MFQTTNQSILQCLRSRSHTVIAAERRIRQAILCACQHARIHEPRDWAHRSPGLVSQQLMAVSK